MNRELTEEDIRKIEAYDRMRDYQNSYVKENYKQVLFRFHKIEDAEVIEKLDRVRNKTDYVRELILKDIQGE